MMQRVFYHYEDLEEYHAGMWKIVRGRERLKNIDAAVDLIRCPEEFKEAMRQAVRLWPKSCEAAFTSADNNQIAWLGQAGCCLSTGATEENTRAAWHVLTADERAEANKVAAEVIAEWRAAYRPADPLQPDFFMSLPC